MKIEITHIVKIEASPIYKAWFNREQDVFIRVIKITTEDGNEIQIKLSNFQAKQMIEILDKEHHPDETA